MSNDASSQLELLGTGAIAGSYRIVAPLGSGTMGHVYEAEDTSSGKRVALKILHKQRQKEFGPRFLREGKTLALLSHPNIVQLVDMGQLDDGALYLATELVDGHSLRELVSQGPLDPPRALAIIRQLLDALDAAHGLGVVHRDIKPENVMLAHGYDGSELVKVLDFGVAKLLADTVAGLGEANLTSVGFSIFGSAHYIAPESVTGQPIDARIDIYSVGAMLYEMLTGRPVFDHEDPAVLLRMQAFDPPPTLHQGAPDRTFAPALEALVARALAKSPDDRYRSAADMIAAVDATLAALHAPESEAATANDAATAASPTASSIATSPTLAAASAPALTATAAPASPSFAPAPASAPTGAPPLASRDRARTEYVRESPQRRRNLVLAAAAAALVLVVIVVATRDRGPAASEPRSAGTSELATRGQQLVADGKRDDAIALLERELAAAPSPDAPALLVLGHARFAAGKRLDALAAYELALRTSPALGSDAELRANLEKVLEGKDSLAVVLALDLLSTLAPPAHEVILAYAKSGKLADGRRRAAMIAKRDGFVE